MATNVILLYHDVDGTLYRDHSYCRLEEFLTLVAARPLPRRVMAVRFDSAESDLWRGTESPEYRWLANEVPVLARETDRRLAEWVPLHDQIRNYAAGAERPVEVRAVPVWH